MGKKMEFKNRRVLVIEDDGENKSGWQQELRRIFEAEKFNVDTAENCGEALTKLENTSYELVTLDLDLGRGINIEWKMIADRLREFHPTTTVFIVTACDEAEPAMDAINYFPVSGYFLKQHFHFDVFKQKLREISFVPLTASLDQIEYLCKKFNTVARQLLYRHGNRPTLSIANEYDVQDLLRALLRLYFDDIRVEEHTPSFCSGSSRIDFLLKDEQIAIETKMTREGLSDKKVGKELVEDISYYRQHPHCKTLACFIYDPEGRIKNRLGVIKDVEGLGTEGVMVKVFIYPTDE